MEGEQVWELGLINDLFFLANLVEYVSTIIKGEIIRFSIDQSFINFDDK